MTKTENRDRKHILSNTFFTDEDEEFCWMCSNLRTKRKKEIRKNFKEKKRLQEFLKIKFYEGNRRTLQRNLKIFVKEEKESFVVFTGEELRYFCIFSTILF